MSTAIPATFISTALGLMTFWTQLAQFKSQLRQEGTAQNIIRAIQDAEIVIQNIERTIQDAERAREVAERPNRGQEQLQGGNNDSSLSRVDIELQQLPPVPDPDASLAGGQ